MKNYLNKLKYILVSAKIKIQKPKREKLTIIPILVVNSILKLTSKFMVKKN